jgi:hypothetical protein
MEDQEVTNYGQALGEETCIGLTASIGRVHFLMITATQQMPLQALLRGGAFVNARQQQPQQ